MSDRRIIAIANQKGGVGKTTTAINVAAALADRGYRTVLVDLDPQGNASTGLGIGSDNRSPSSYDLLMGDIALDESLRETDIVGLSVIPATADLSSADLDLAEREARTHQLRQRLENVDVDVVVIDCPPALGLLTLNALVASDSVLVPLQAEFYALEGLSQLMLTVRQVRQINRHLRIEGVLLTMADSRNNLSQQVEADARKTLGDLVFSTVIPRNVRVSESPSFAQPVIHYDPQSKGSQAYLALVDEMTARAGWTRKEAADVTE